VLATLTFAAPVLATTALEGRLAFMSFAGVTGDGLIGAATARAGVVGDVTGGMSGAETAAAEAVPRAAVFTSDAAGMPAIFASLEEEPGAMEPCTFIDDPDSAEVFPGEGVDSSVEE
jgi:NADPH-dependent ferric siderophore reductase